MYAAKAAQAAAVSPGGSPGQNIFFFVESVLNFKQLNVSVVKFTLISGPMMSPGSQWGGSSYSGEGPYGGF